MASKGQTMTKGRAAPGAKKSPVRQRESRQSNVQAIAQRIRAVRSRTKISLDTLAERVGLDKSYLSRIERGQKTPSVATLLNIAAALDIQVAQLFGERTTPDSITVVRRDNHVAMQTRKGEGAAAYETVLPASAHRRMSVFVVDPSRVTGEEKAVHSGDELIYVLAGKIDVVFSDRRVSLSAGDVVHFEGDLKHQIVTLGATPASVLVIIANDLATLRKLNPDR